MKHVKVFMLKLSVCIAFCFAAFSFSSAQTISTDLSWTFSNLQTHEYDAGLHSVFYHQQQKLYYAVVRFSKSQQDILGFNAYKFNPVSNKWEMIPAISNCQAAQCMSNSGGATGVIYYKKNNKEYFYDPVQNKTTMVSDLSNAMYRIDLPQFTGNGIVQAGCMKNGTSANFASAILSYTDVTKPTQSYTVFLAAAINKVLDEISDVPLTLTHFKGFRSAGYGYIVEFTTNLNDRRFAWIKLSLNASGATITDCKIIGTNFEFRKFSQNRSYFYFFVGSSVHAFDNNGDKKGVFTGGLEDYLYPTGKLIGGPNYYGELGNIIYHKSTNALFKNATFSLSDGLWSVESQKDMQRGGAVTHKLVLKKIQ